MERREIEKRALEVLRRHSLLSIPIDPVLLANKEGIHVRNAKFSDDGISGMVAKRGNVVSMLVDQGDPAYRKRFSIAHELGHHFLHLVDEGEIVTTKQDLFRESLEEDERSDQRRCHEIEANQFAAALLMPEELVRDVYEHIKDEGELARIFNVSKEAISIRLRTLGLTR